MKDRKKKETEQYGGTEKKRAPTKGGKEEINVRRKKYGGRTMQDEGIREENCFSINFNKLDVTPNHLPLCGFYGSRE